MTRIIGLVDTGWLTALTLFRVLWICRVSVVAVALGILIVGTDQAREIIHSSNRAATFFAVLLMAVFAWYWASIVLRSPYSGPTPLPGPRWLSAWNDLLVGHVPLLIGAVPILDAASDFLNDSLVWAYGAAFYGLVSLAGRGRATHWKSKLPRWLVNLDNGTTPRLILITALIALAAGYYVVGTGFFRLVDVDATIPAVLFAFAMLIPVFSSLLVLSYRSRFPFLAIAVLLVFLGPHSGHGRFHDVRTCQLGTATEWDDCSGALVNRTPLTDAFVAWWNHNASMTRPIGNSGVVVPPMVLVTAAGGASRAAYWTSQVLAKIAETEPGFADRVFLISGVSGGSLGATVFRSQVEAARRTNRDSTLLVGAPSRARQFLAHDFLSPALVAGIYVDLPARAGFQSLLPRSILPGDRTVALEKAWEYAWRKSGEASPDWSDGFVRSFAGNGGQAGPWPILALNGAAVTSPRKIVTSNVDLGALNRIPIQATLDPFTLLQRDIPISTAVTMSARFPVLSSSGGLRIPDGAVLERVSDGGFLENFGATTAAEVGRYLTYAFSQVQKGQYQTVPIVIVISSDPALTAGFTNSPCDAVRDPIAQARCLGAKPSDEHPILDALGPLVSGRGSRGQASVFSLRNLVAEFRELLLNRLVDRAGLQREEVSSRLGGVNDRVDFFHFRLCTADGFEPVLSWRLSEHSLDTMDAALGLDPKASGDSAQPCGNRIQFFRLCVRLARLTGQAQSDLDATNQCSTRWPRPERWRCTPAGTADRAVCDIAPMPR